MNKQREKEKSEIMLFCSDAAASGESDVCPVEQVAAVRRHGQSGPLWRVAGAPAPGQGEGGQAKAAVSAQARVLPAPRGSTGDLGPRR